MKSTRIKALLLGAGATLVAGCAMTQPAGPQGMTFFVTSANPGKGGDLGGPKAPIVIAMPSRKPPARHRAYGALT